MSTELIKSITVLPDEPDLAVRGVLLLVVGGYPDIGGGNFQITGGHGVSPFTVPESGTGVANSNTKTAIMQSKRRRHLESRCAENAAPVYAAERCERDRTSHPAHKLDGRCISWQERRGSR